MKNLKLPRFPRLKLRRRKKLRARTARRPLRIAATADYDEMTEPNMKLSRALLIVLLLHVVAVSGIVAFNAIKTRQTPNSSRNAGPAAASSRTSGAVQNKEAVPRTVPAAKESQRRESPSAAQTTAETGKKADHKNEHVKTTEAAGKGESGKIYVVVKGDNPVTIARKFKVPYDDLIEINHIDDPRRLQIGQKLVIPAKTTKGRRE